MSEEFLDMGRQALAAQPFSAWLGLRLDAFAPGQVTLALPLTSQHTQQDGWVHDGVLSAVAATALLLAGGAALDTPVVLAEYKINFLMPARGMELQAQARATGPRPRSRQALGRCEVWAR